MRHLTHVMAAQERTRLRMRALSGFLLLFVQSEQDERKLGRPGNLFTHLRVPEATRALAAAGLHWEDDAHKVISALQDFIHRSADEAGATMHDSASREIATASYDRFAP